MIDFPDKDGGIMRRKNELDVERQYLNVLYRKYILAYHVDLENDSAEIVRLNPSANVWKMEGMRPGVKFNYEEHIRSFAKQFVVDNKERFWRVLNRHYIEEHLQTASRFSFRFVSIPNKNGNQNYEVQVMRVNPNRFDGKVIIVSEEIDNVIIAEKRQQMELDIERQYLDVLARDYLAVYHVKLYENTSTLIKVDSHIKRENAERIFKREFNDYLGRVDLYCRKFVFPSFREEFKRVMSLEHILKELSNTPKFTYRYRTTQSDTGQQYFEIQVMRMNDDLKDGNVLIGFRQIDDIIIVEQRRQMELKERLEQEKNQNEVLSALGSNYHAIFHIDLKTDSYIQIACRDEIKYYYNDKEPSASKMLTQVCEKIVDERHFERMQQFFNLDTLARRLQNREFVEVECITKSGNWHRSHLIVKRRNATGVVTHVLYVTQMIDDEKQYEEHLIVKAEHADLANRAKTDFISQVAHDIRTPMNSIFGFLEIAESNLDNLEKVKYSLNKIRVAGEFLKDLVNDVLDITRMENGSMKLQPTEIILSDTLKEFVVSMQNAKFEKNQNFYFKLEHILHDYVIVDELRLKQIYANVISNAIKYTPNGGTIEFSVYQEEIIGSDRVCLIATIKDNGMGMSKEFMERMFTKFERETDTRINKVSGYGLGLSIVKQLVELMNGSIDVKSKPGEGTTFCIKLEVPYVEGVVNKITMQEPDYEEMCCGMHLLVAEDNQLNREVITELLDMHHISCECVEDGRLCLERFRFAEEGSYDAILMDMQMPNMNGVEATKQIRALPFAWAQNIPIIAMTANALKDDVKKCLDAGMNRHLSKPIDMKKLLKALAEVKR